MYQIGYFVLPASDTVENHTRIHIQPDIPLLLPGQSLYQCTWVPTSDGYADVAALNSVLLVSTRAEELVRELETVYHGSYAPIKEPRIIPGRYTKDFGPGFYCTRFREQAARWARRNDTPVVSKYTVGLTTGLKILEFERMTEGWLDFIANCRAGVPHSYDVVIGPMADDQVYDHVEDFLAGRITRVQFWTLVRFRYPTDQIVFCTEAGLRCCTFISSKGC